MLRVNAVKELPALSRPALSRMGDAGASDREGPSDDRSVADGRGSRCFPVVEVKRVGQLDGAGGGGRGDSCPQRAPR